ncbi:MAG: hypothetical protein HFH91_18645 [Lachnospiraceae bacterium]|nr:hypothetical protein [Lachnospiraceae bacterium]
MVKAGMSQAIVDSGEKMMQLIKDGDIHMHIMGNSNLERDSDVEHREMMEYGEFIKTRFCYDLMNLTGSRI